MNSRPMSNIDKQSVQVVADLKVGYTLGHADVAILNELARIALASLEAEPVSFDALRDAVAEVSGGPAMEWSDIYKGHHSVPFINFNSLARIVDKFRTAQPAPENAEPVAWLWSHRKHPSEVTLVRPEDDERADGAHWSGWSCQALYAAPQQEVKP